MKAAQLSGLAAGVFLAAAMFVARALNNWLDTHDSLPFSR